MAVARLIVACFRISVNCNRRGQGVKCRKGGKLAGDSMCKGCCFCEVVCIRPSRPQRGREGVLACKRRRRNRMEAMRFKDIAQLDEGIVEGAVAEGHDGNGNCAAAVDGIQILEQEVRQPSCIGRTAEQHKVGRRKLREGGAGLRQCEIVKKRFDAKIVCERFRDRADDLFGGAGRTEIDLTNAFDFHTVTSQSC